MPDTPPLPPDPDLDDLATVASTLLSSGALTDALRVISTDSGEAAVVAARSSWHPLGFAKLLLGGLPESPVRVRLHVWAHAGRRTAQQDDPHAHRWRFASSVAWGGPLRVVHFEEVAEGDEFHRFEYGLAEATMAASGTRGLRVVGEMRRRRGDVYRCERGTVHTIRPVDPSVLTTTLIAQGPEVDASTPVYRREPEPAITGRHPMRTDEVVQLVGRVLDAI
jgi:hypothetical protein